MTLIPDMLAMVERFNREVIGLPIPDAPRRLDPDRKLWAQGAMAEELNEFENATSLEDEVDALLDLAYFAVGRIVEMGILPGPVFEEVHSANMGKERGELSKRPHARGYDAVKPAGWKAPDLKPYLTIRKSDLEVLRLLDDMAGKNPTGRLRAAQAAMQDGPVFHVLPNAHEWEPEAAEEFYSSGLIDMDFSELEERVMALTSADLGEDWMAREGRLAQYGPDPVPDPKILVIGHARHGKDTVAAILERLYDLTFTSSSEFCAERVILPEVRKHWTMFHGASPTKWSKPAFPNYETVKQCFEDRVNHRAFWYNTITAFNTPDKTRLGRAIFEENDVYCGVRNPAEFHALVNAGIPDFVVWVDRSEHLLDEDRSSMGLEPWMADFVIDNNGSLEDLERNVRSLFDRLLEDYF